MFDEPLNLPYQIHIEQGSKFDQMGRAYKQVSISTTVQNFTHLSYSFRVTKPIIGAGGWHGPIIYASNTSFYFKTHFIVMYSNINI